MNTKVEKNFTFSPKKFMIPPKLLFDTNFLLISSKKTFAQSFDFQRQAELMVFIFVPKSEIETHV